MYGYQSDTRQRQLEQEFKARMTFDQGLEYYEYILTQMKNKWLL